MIEKIYDNDYVVNHFFSSIFQMNFLYHTTKLMMIYFTHNLKGKISSIISSYILDLYDGGKDMHATHPKLKVYSQYKI